MTLSYFEDGAEKAFSKKSQTEAIADAVEAFGWGVAGEAFFAPTELYGKGIVSNPVGEGASSAIVSILQIGTAGASLLGDMFKGGWDMLNNDNSQEQTLRDSLRDDMRSLVGAIIGLVPLAASGAGAAYVEEIPGMKYLPPITFKKMADLALLIAGKNAEHAFDGLVDYVADHFVDDVFGSLKTKEDEAVKTE